MPPPVSLTARRPAGPLHGTARVPGDRLVSHCALTLAGLAVGETRIEGLHGGEDVLRTAGAMRALGAAVTRDGSVWRVAGRGVGGLAEPDNVLDVGDSGTAAGLLAGTLASHDFHAVVTGDANLRRRPMHRLTEPLAQCGARFSAREGGRLPLAIEGARDAMPIRCRLLAASAQVKSAILLAGLNAPGDTVVEEPAATRDHTEAMLRYFGATVATENSGAGRVVTLAGQPELRARDVAVPGDPSCAAFPLVAALLVPGSAVTVAGVGLNPLRTGLLDTLREMGAELTVTGERVAGGEPVGDILTRYGPLRGVDVPADRAPSMCDDYPALATAAAFAAGTTRLRGLSDLPTRQNGRLSAIAAMLEAAGVRVAVEGGDLLVEGAARQPGGCTVLTRADHRLAMSALVLGQATDAPVAVDDAACIESGFPGFVSVVRGLGMAVA